MEKATMNGSVHDDDFDVYAFVNAKRGGLRIKPPKKIVSTKDERGWITTVNETERLCIDDRKSTRIVLIADLRRGHPDLRPGVLGRTIPNTSDYYRYVGVEFDNGVTEVVSVTAIQPIAEGCDKSAVVAIRRTIKGTVFDADERVADKQARRWEEETYGNRMDLRSIARGGKGPHEVYAYTFPSLMELAEAQGRKHYPVKIGFTGAAGDQAPGLQRIDSQLGDATGRFEPTSVLVVWNTWNGRSLETRVHRHLRELGRRVRSAVGREWFCTNTHELLAVLNDKGDVDRSGLPLNGPVPESFQGFLAPNRTFAEDIQVICTRLRPDGMVSISGPIRFDDLLEEAAPPDVRKSRQAR
jgi:hypothetical protein